MLAHCLLAFSQTQKLGIEPSGLQRPLCICPVCYMVSLFSTSEATGTFQISPPITALTQHLPWYVLQSDAICIPYLANIVLRSLQFAYKATDEHSASADLRYVTLYIRRLSMHQTAKMALPDPAATSMCHAQMPET